MVRIAINHIFHPGHVWTRSQAAHHLPPAPPAVLLHLKKLAPCSAAPTFSWLLQSEREWPAVLHGGGTGGGTGHGTTEVELFGACNPPR